jgi:nucleoside-diphosphate-sugar epimerase
VERLSPGSEKFYTLFDSFTYSRLHASFNLWAALEPKCANQAFNVVNGDTESWQNMWPKLARRFDCKIPEDQFSGSTPDASEMKLAETTDC